jgi:hypothetical protein
VLVGEGDWAVVGEGECDYGPEPFGGECEMFAGMVAWSVDDLLVLGVTEIAPQPAIHQHEGLLWFCNGESWSETVLADASFSGAWDLGDDGVLLGAAEYDPDALQQVEALGIRLFRYLSGELEPWTPLASGQPPAAVYAGALDDVFLLTAIGDAHHFNGEGLYDIEVLLEEEPTGGGNTALWGDGGDTVFGVVNGELLSLVCP